MTLRIALLIDADNAPAAKVGDVLNDLARYGECSIRRAYGNWTKSELKAWIEELHESAIRPMQQFDLTKQKNAADMALAIDAVELLHSSQPDAFAIMSSDSDFTPLVHYLREKGRAVYGYGRANTPAPFKSACTQFTIVDQLGKGATLPGETAVEPVAAEQPAKRTATKRTAKKATAKPADTKSAETKPDAKPDVKVDARVADARAPERVDGKDLKRDARLIKLLRNVIESAASEEDGFVRVSTVGQQIRNQSSIDPRNYGYATWTKLLKEIDLFELRDEGTTTVSVRDIRS
ncbi:MAG TPA: NYN domain-containing protein [Nocardioides sp.]|nr:NYN domain-containing protein [Nocardioides sp.]